MSYDTLDQGLRDHAETTLTPKQLRVLKLWLAGYGTTRISIITDVSEPTARAHLRRAIQKLRPYVHASDYREPL